MTTRMEGRDDELWVMKSSWLHEWKEEMVNYEWRSVGDSTNGRKWGWATNVEVFVTARMEGRDVMITTTGSAGKSKMSRPSKMRVNSNKHRGLLSERKNLKKKRLKYLIEAGIWIRTLMLFKQEWKGRRDTSAWIFMDVFNEGWWTVGDYVAAVGTIRMPSQGLTRSPDRRL